MVLVRDPARCPEVDPPRGHRLATELIADELEEWPAGLVSPETAEHDDVIASWPAVPRAVQQVTGYVGDARRRRALGDQLVTAVQVQPSSRGQGHGVLGGVVDG